jgi:hypothetical protein
VPEVRAIDRHGAAHLSGCAAGRRNQVSAWLGNRNLFFEWKNRTFAHGKVTRSNVKYYRAFLEAARIKLPVRLLRRKKVRKWPDKLF